MSQEETVALGSESRSQDVSVTVPVILDHNRMLVEGEIQRRDGNRRKVRIWVDTGNPDLFLSAALVGDLDLPSPESGAVSPPPAMRIGEMALDLADVRALHGDA